MHLLLYILIFILGVCIGSFLNVLVDRLPRGEDILISRSRCEKCNKTLKWVDLIPVFSFLRLKGKCGYCRTAIPQRLLWIETITGLVFWLISIYAFYSSLPVTWLIYSLVLFSLLEVIFFSDLFYGIIPDLILIILGIISLFYEWFLNYHFLFRNLPAGLMVFFFFFLLFYFTKGKGMGFGDVKFSFLIGFILGLAKAIIALYVSFLTASFISIILIVFKKKKLRGDTINFGPFLVLGILMAYFWGDKIINIVKSFL